MSYSGAGEHPEAVLNILLTVLQKTPAGGATMGELQEAYRQVKDRVPCEKTVRRIIQRINRFFDLPESEDGRGDGRAGRAIVCKNNGGQYRYVFQRDLALSFLELELVRQAVLVMYLLKSHFTPEQFAKLQGHVVEGALRRSSLWYSIIRELERYVYNAGPGPADPRQSFRWAIQILLAIKLAKRVWIKYHRSYDGQDTEREVEPYGLLCRQGIWYLVGLCHMVGNRRIFRLDHILQLHIVENSHYTLPPSFSLREMFSRSWGVWTVDHSDPPQTVRLRVGAGLAHRFRVTRYHESQSIRELADGSVEISFVVSGVEEMLPWILSWGAELEVLEPDWLRETVASVLADALALYNREIR